MFRSECHVFFKAVSMQATKNSFRDIGTRKAVETGSNIKSYNDVSSQHISYLDMISVNINICRLSLYRVLQRPQAIYWVIPSMKPVIGLCVIIWQLGHRVFIWWTKLRSTDVLLEHLKRSLWPLRVTQLAKTGSLGFRCPLFR